MSVRAVSSEMIHNSCITSRLSKHTFRAPSPSFLHHSGGLGGTPCSANTVHMRFLISGLGFYLIACLLYAHYIWSQTRNNWHRRARAGALGAGLLLLLIAVLVSVERSSIQGAAILESTTLVTETGSIDVPEGVKVSFIEETDLGAEISLPNGVRGYVDASVLGYF